jgi:hypothetical protein
MTMKGIETHDLGHGLTLVHDRNADCFDNGWAVIEGDLPEAQDYERWWDAVRPQVVETDERILAVLAEQITGCAILGI